MNSWWLEDEWDWNSYGPHGSHSDLMAMVPTCSWFLSRLCAFFPKEITVAIRLFYFSCRSRCRSLNNPSCWLLEFRCFSDLYLKTSSAHSQSYLWVSCPSASQLDSNLFYFLLSCSFHHFALFLNSFSLYFPYISYLFSIYSVCTLENLFWSPSVGFGYHWSCFGTIFRPSLKVNWNGCNPGW